MPELRAGGLALRHEPSTQEPGLQRGEIAGHLHPIARVLTRSGSVRRRCFLIDAVRCVMPAFGAFAGGLNIRDPAFPRLFGSHAVTAFVLGREGVHAVPQSHCVPEPRGFVPL
jgi:metallophosphoesterase superfamily enzyme